MNSCDYITIDNLEVFANHGVLKEETSLGQKFLICAKLYFNAEKAAISDNLNDSVNYAEICAFITKYMRDNTFKLIEKVAYSITEELLYKYDILEKVEITVKKPWAPIGLPVDCVMVTVSKAWKRVYLALGSNIGDTKENLEFAINELKKDKNIRLLEISSFITTKPYGGVEQDDFLNGAIEINTIYSPVDLLKKINEIEALRGRTRDIHWGPRTLDIDILMYEDEIICEKNLVVPHPDMCNRDFVLKPMTEIAPYYVHPIKRMTMQELLNKLQSK